MNNIRFFKYIPKQFADGMLNDGKIKIGTIANYRKGENKEITDSEEAMEIGVFKQKYANELMPKDFYKMWFNTDHYPPEGSENITIYNSYYEKRMFYPNVYVYCLTNIPSESVMNKFGELSDGSCQEMVCIEILDINHFIFAIFGYLLSKNLLKPNAWPLVRPCRYIENARRFEYNEDFETRFDYSAYFIKDISLNHQAEFRIVYPSIDESNTLEDVYATIPELTQNLKLHKFFRFFEH